MVWPDPFPFPSSYTLNDQSNFRLALVAWAGLSGSLQKYWAGRAKVVRLARFPCLADGPGESSLWSSSVWLLWDPKLPFAGALKAVFVFASFFFPPQHIRQLLSMEERKRKIRHRKDAHLLPNQGLEYVWIRASVGFAVFKGYLFVSLHALSFFKKREREQESGPWL